MATAAYLPIPADRAGPCIRTIYFRGLDLTGIDMKLQARLLPDTPGDPLFELNTVTIANAEGIRFIGMTMDGLVPVSEIRLRINESTMKDIAQVPYSGEVGSASSISYDLIGTFSGDKRRLVYGEIIALPTTFGADNAPANRPVGYGSRAGEAWDSAQLTFSNGSVLVSIYALDRIEALVDDFRDYVDGLTGGVNTELADKLDKSGGSLTGNLNMTSNRITGLAAAVNPGDAPNKGQVDSLVSTAVAAEAAIRLSVDTTQNNAIENNYNFLLGAIGDETTDRAAEDMAIRKSTGAVISRDYDASLALTSDYVRHGDITPNGTWIGSLGFTAFAIGRDCPGDIGVSQLIDGFGMDLGAPAGTVTVRGRLYSRAQVDTVPAVPPTTPVDMLIDTMDLTLTQAGLQAGGVIQRVNFNLGPGKSFLAETGKTYLMVVQMLDGSGNPLAGVQARFQTPVATRPQRRAGWFMSTSTGGLWGAAPLNYAIAAALNTRVTSKRLETFLTPLGRPKTGVVAPDLLKRTRSKVGAIKGGVAGQQLKIALIGDSWSDIPSLFSRAFVNRLLAELGDAGVGYVGFAWNSSVPGFTSANSHGNARADVALTYTGSIATSFTGASTPDLGYAYLSTAGDRISVSFPAGHNAAKLFYQAGTGSVRYRWNGGAWTTLNLAGSGAANVNLTGAPSTSGTLDVELVSGGAALSGVQFTSAARGVRVDKIAGAGNAIATYLAADQTQWTTQFAALQSDVAILLFGTNDQVSKTPAEFGAEYAALVDRVRLARPNIEIILSVPAENVAGRVTPMAQLAAAADAVALEKGCTRVDLEYYMTADMFDASLVHPTTDGAGNGNYAVSEAFVRPLLYL